VIALDEIPDVCSSCFYVRVSQTGPSPPLEGHVQRPRPNLGIFIDEQGATSVESLLKGATAHESLRSTVLSETDKSCKLIPQSGERKRACLPRNFQKYVQLLVQLNISAGCGPAC